MEKLQETRRSNDGASDDVDATRAREERNRLAPTEDLPRSPPFRRPIPPPVNESVSVGVGDVFFERFRVLEVVGHGGFCRVFRAVETATGATVALKFLSRTDGVETVVPRMQRELRLTRDLGHPNIVKVHELIEDQGQVCLVMDFVEGTTLKRFVGEGPQLPTRRIMEILVDLTSAVAAVHASEIVHRDLKPQNVMISESGRVKLLDFGLARTSNSTGLTADGTILGTPDYMSPEQVNGEAADSRSDVYSLGIIAWELFTGRTPYTGDTPIAVALRHVQSRIPDLSSCRSDVPAEVSNLVARMTDPRPDRRPQSAVEVLFALERSGESGSALMTGSERPKSKLRWAAMAAAVAAIATWIGFFSATPSADPFADGAIVATVQPKISIIGSSLESKLFLENIAAAIPENWTGPEISFIDLEEDLHGDPKAAASAGVEHLLEVSFLEAPDDQGPKRLQMRVISTGDGSVWWDSGGTDELTLDYAGMVEISRRMARQYGNRIAQALEEANPPGTSSAVQ